MAVGTVSIVKTESGGFGKLVATCTASSTDATFPSTDLPAFTGRLLVLRANPGTPAPQNAYDVTLVDADGVDRLQGAGANLHTTNSEEAPIVYSGGAGVHPACINEKLTLTFAGNNVNSAVTVVTLVYEL